MNKSFTLLAILLFPALAWSQDLYEPDDDAASATILPVSNFGTQQHNFHDQGDADWFQFYALDDQFYEVLVFDTGPDADTTITLYESDGVTEAFPVIDDTFAGEDELLSWRGTADDFFYIKVSNFDPDTHGSDASYKIVLYRPEAPDTGVITGIVVSNQELGEVGGTVLTSDSGSSAIVNDDGSFEMEVDSGDVSISSIRDGFAETIAELTVSSDETTEVQFELAEANAEDSLTKVVTTNGSQSTAGFSVGTTRTDDDQFSNAFGASEEVMITGTVIPETDHIGERALVFVVMGSLTSEGLKFEYLDVNGDLVTWDEDFTSLAPALDTMSLIAQQPITIYTGNLLSGKFRIWIGYQSLSGGPLHYTAKAYKLDIND